MAGKKGKVKQMDFTKGPILKPMIVFSLPVLFGNIFSALYNIVDSVVVGQFVGSYALAAVNTSFSISMICTAVYAGFGMGSAVLIGQLFGAGRKEDLSRGAATALLGALLVGGAMSCVGLLCSRPLLILINTPDEILEAANSYLRITFCGCAPQLLYFMGSGMIRGLGDSKWPTVFLVICALINIVLDLYFVVSLGLGVAGVALATVIAQTVCAVLVVWRIAFGGYGVTFTKKNFRIHGDMMRRILYVGVPRAIQQLADSIGLVIIQSFANSFGTDFVAVNGIVQKIDTFAMLPIRSVSETIIMFNAQNLGAGKNERAKKGNRMILFVIFLCGLATGVLLWIFTKDLFRIFISTSDPSYENILSTGEKSIRILAFFYSVYAVQQAFISIMNGIGVTLPVMYIGLVCTAARVLITYLLAMPTRQCLNLYWATDICNTMLMTGIWLYYRFGSWEKNSFGKKSEKVLQTKSA